MDKLSALKAATCIAAKNFERWSKLAALTSESSSVLHSTTLLETSQLLSDLLAEREGMEQTLNVANDATRIWKERALAAEKQLATQVQASGWISWHGGMFRPVRSDTIIDVMFANGNVKPNICAGSVVFEWQKTPKDSQRVTAYRLHRRGG